MQELLRLLFRILPKDKGPFRRDSAHAAHTHVNKIYPNRGGFTDLPLCLSRRTSRIPTMPLPRLPLEIRLEIIELACLMDMNTQIVLSQTTRELRDISRFHRYHSVKIHGHEQLLAFEKQFSSAHEDSRSVVHLLVILPPLTKAAYADEDDNLSDASMDSSSSYKTSWDDSDEDEHAMDLDSGSSESHASSDSWDTADEMEFAEMSEEEIVELREETRDIARVLRDVPMAEAMNGVTFVWADSPLHPMDVGGQDLSRLDHLSTYSKRVCDLEFAVYSALRRVLEYASASLTHFSLFWRPHCDFTIEALCPALPKLRYLAVFEHRPTNNYTAHQILQQEYASFSTPFPALVHFDVNSIWSTNWGGTILRAAEHVPTICSMTLPCKIVR